MKLSEPDLLRSLIVGAIILVCLLAPAASQTQCPQGVPSCKVLILTPDEEQILVGPRGIFNAAARGAFLDLFAPTEFLRNKIEKAAAGEVAKPEPSHEAPKADSK